MADMKAEKTKACHAPERRCPRGEGGEGGGCNKGQEGHGFCDGGESEGGGPVFNSSVVVQS